MQTTIKRRLATGIAAGALLLALALGFAGDASARSGYGSTGNSGAETMGIGWCRSCGG